MITVVIPTLNAEARLALAFAPLVPAVVDGLVGEVVVVDGGSHDRTLDIAEHAGATIVTSAQGRGPQLGAGARAARGTWLLFLHADTVLPDLATERIEAAVTGGALWGRFDVRIDGASVMLPIVAALMNGRSRLTGIATGDQAIFVTCEAFARVGGFPDIPLMEDIAFSSAMRRIARPACLAEKVTTSGRRWEKHGVWRTILTMWWLRLRFWLGVSPQTLAREYGYAPRHD